MSNLNNLDKRKPGESVRDYMIRHNAHPSQENRVEVTAEEEAAMDFTHERMGGGAILTVGAVPPVKGKRGSR